jgi:hypothetical protein
MGDFIHPSITRERLAYIHLRMDRLYLRLSRVRSSKERHSVRTSLRRWRKILTKGMAT